ncbi:hypothetical protein BU14_0298s0009 [Porphyra umbilicalis]|uniref:Uncharacterized protein n=1 Tax=Porphyra umbilicalis TaxID=2786 RepID=A0A1X6P0F6_PORUM|nr:hypothetical protein BU14_0298s0009 [Porphyra umbilicalis]|eukprot:OSX74265.1 hypothetical protein BU14_0298s0009 [Porphyra umbilicalis]
MQEKMRTIVCVATNRSGAPPPPPPPTRLTVRGTHTLTPHYTLLLDAPPAGLAFSPDGDGARLLVVSPAAARADVLDVAAGEWAAALDGGGRGVAAASWSACGRYVAVVPADGLSVCVWGVASGVRVAELGRVKVVAPLPLALPPLRAAGAAAATGAAGGRGGRSAAAAAAGGLGRGRAGGGVSGAKAGVSPPSGRGGGGRPPPPPPPTPLLAYSPVAPLAAAVARSPTGDRVCLYATDAAVELTDVASGAAAGTITGWAPLGDWAVGSSDTAGLAWAPDGRCLAVWDGPLSYRLALYTATGERVAGVEADATTAAVAEGVLGAGRGGGRRHRQRRRPPPLRAASACQAWRGPRRAACWRWRATTSPSASSARITARSWRSPTTRRWTWRR